MNYFNMETFSINVIETEEIMFGYLAKDISEDAFYKIIDRLLNDSFLLYYKGVIYGTDDVYYDINSIIIPDTYITFVCEYTPTSFIFDKRTFTMGDTSMKTFRKIMDETSTAYRQLINS